jgi:hypothetical protein
MSKIPYVIQCELFVRADYKRAEELLAEYNDFYVFNMAQYNSMYHKLDDTPMEKEEEIDEQQRLEQADKIAKVATDHFATLFGNKDFGESSLVALCIDWEALQRILLGEYRSKVLVQDSAMNRIAPVLRNVASIMLFAERLIGELSEMNIPHDQIKILKDGFQLLMERNQKESFTMPEYHKMKPQILKFKKPEQYIELCNRLFFNEGGK